MLHSCPSLRSIGLSFCLLLPVALIVFGATFQYPFISFDDSLLIYQNEAAWGFSWNNIVTAFTTYDPELYIPLTLLSYQFDYTLGGLNPLLFRVHQLLLHTLNATLVTAFCSLFVRRWWLALVGGVVFLVHPLQVEAVVWMSARKDVLSTLWFFASLLAYVKYMQSDNHRWYITSVILFGVGLLAKVSIVLLPVILIGIDVLEQRTKSIKQCVFEKIPYLTLGMVFGVVALLGKAAPPGQSILNQLLLACMSVAFYVQKFFVPVDLALQYPYTNAISLWSLDAGLPFLLTLILIGCIVWLFWRNRVYWFALSFFLLALLPTFFNLIKGSDAYFASNRYMYVAIVGIAILLLSAVDYSTYHNRIRERIAMGVLGFACITFGVCSFLQAQLWQSGAVLYEYTIALYPNDYIAQINLGNEYRNKKQYKQALQYYSQALDSNPSASKAYYNQALTYQEIGHIDAAIEAYTNAILYDGKYALAMVNLGKIYADREEHTLAEELYVQAIKADPSYALAYYNLGVLHVKHDKYQKASEQFHSAIERAPHHVSSRINLIWSLLALELIDEALMELNNAMRRFPDEKRLQDILHTLQSRGIVQ